MKTSKLLSSALIAVASLSAAGAFAGDMDNYPVQPAQASTLTRAQVRAELAQAERDGTLIQVNDAYPGDVGVANSGKTRAQVRAELVQAQREGLTQRIDNNYPGDVAQGSNNLNLRG